MNGRAGQYQRAGILLLLVTMHFVVPELVHYRVAPDLLLLTLLVFAIRAQPGPAALLGFVMGLVTDSLVGTAFGAGAFAYTVVGYLAAWGKAVFFTENLLVNAGLIFAGVWLRDLLVISIGRTADANRVLWELVFWSPLKAMSSAMVGLLVLWLFRRWLHVRILQ